VSFLPATFKNIITKGQYAGWRTFGNALYPKPDLPNEQSKAFGLPSLTAENSIIEHIFLNHHIFRKIKKPECLAALNAL